jgi:dTDP-N-acetylfucosamine:lipid II N-acetylfucosaminyltransferase
LSYGDAAYGQSVAALGRERFGERLDALTGWMALADYNERIRHCGFVVMNHRRQQAVGNVTSALYKGATVYLRRENPLFDFLADLGVCLREIDDNAGALEALSAQERSRNREIIGAHYARARVLSAIRSLLGTSH